MIDRLKFFIRRLSERLWVRPLAVCVVSIAAVFLAKSADRLPLEVEVPEITTDSIEVLLSIMASSMLVIATFAVASMVAAYSSAATSATPRSFRLVVSDDVSQNALSTFVGAFIFSIVALTATKNEYFGDAGRAALFAMTAIVFAAVIVTFVYWVDRIARLGRLGTTIDKVEEAAAKALMRRRAAPTLRGAEVDRAVAEGRPVYAAKVGYVQRVDVPTLQSIAANAGGWILVTALPGTLAIPGRALAHVGPDESSGKSADPAGETEATEPVEFDDAAVAKAFVIGSERLFDEDPRFGILALSEIADRALSPAVNDPGTAVAILGSFVRVFTEWAAPAEDLPEPEFDRVQVPELSVRDLFDDAFTAIARSGAGAVEVVVRLLKALESLATIGQPAIRRAAHEHARMALARAENALTLPEDLAAVRAAAKFAQDP